MAHVTSNVYAGMYSQVGGPAAEWTVSVDTGTGSNRAILMLHYRRSDRSPVINTVTIGGQSATVLDSDRTIATNIVVRPIVLINPSSTGMQNFVINTTTSGSNSSAEVLVAVYDDVDSNASPASLLTISGTQTITSPWTGSVTLDIPSAIGHVAVGQLLGASSDVAYNYNPTNITERLDSVGGGVSKWSGDAAGAATVSASWALSLLNQDMTTAKHGWSLPPAVVAPVPVRMRLRM